MSKNLQKKYPSIACCGIDCGLCPSYYTEGPSRCPGCLGPNFSDKHPSCSIITCCVKTNNFETCAECSEFPCQKIGKWDKGDSFVTHKVCLDNLRFIKEQDLEPFIQQQSKRMEILKILLKKYNEGRSKSFYCQAAALLPLESLVESFKESIKRMEDEGIEGTDMKSISKVIRENFNKAAKDNGIILKLRR